MLTYPYGFARRPPSQIPAVAYFVSLYLSISLYLLRACAAGHLSSSSSILQTKTTERRMIPMSILLKLGKYEIKFKDNPVKVEVLDSEARISSWITERLKPRLLEEGPIIVGLNLHASKNRRRAFLANSLLVICIDDENCLVVQLKYVDKIPEDLLKFLGDSKICFVGDGLDLKLSRGVLPCKTVELSHLVARICQKPSYCNSSLKALATASEVPYESPALGRCCSGGRINYEARVFSKEEVKALVHDAYFCYKIGQKLVNELLCDDTTQGTTQETQERPGNETT
ncbi:hypothetical protein Nepgr_013887 [Nepenthes gracilis]|uniref:3'-5' exonuclease domain-containing protein n=1 Tax=Nepenthes gracilis TaxID=150966 RepID=A0AAD3XPS9_NEPGR|nr:hypothetical protein Nepgr_013887 [Nepenthes gracilis]